jgi:hypothetical protein
VRLVNAVTVPWYEDGGLRRRRLRGEKDVSEDALVTVFGLGGD